MVAKSSRGGGLNKLIPKLKTKIYKLEQEVKGLKTKSIEYVDVIKEVERIVEIPVEVEVIKKIDVPYEVKVPYEVIIEKIVEKPIEIIKEVPYEVIREVEVIREIPYEIVEEVEVIKEIPYEVIKEIIVDREVIKEIKVPFEVIKKVEVPYEVKVFVPTEDPKQEIRHREEIGKLAKEFNAQNKQSTETLELRYQAARNLSQAKYIHQRHKFDVYKEKDIKRFKRFSTYSYLLTIYSLTQILWMLI